ncbi:uncharacterized protein BJX67DRAFT_350085 [Aspergillus lucknowensis]|uniref:Uncharacterized protein n=1 Tax=Aspergillus lucknowensis TaxID=176173 RepID=A0ABR4LW16_9EURO
MHLFGSLRFHCFSSCGSTPASTFFLPFHLAFFPSLYPLNFSTSSFLPFRFLLPHCLLPLTVPSFRSLPLNSASPNCLSYLRFARSSFAHRYPPLFALFPAPPRSVL